MKIYACDGGCPNNGNGATVMNWKVFDISENRLVVSKSVERNNSTNNLAEVFAILETCKLAPTKSVVYSDSNIALNWINNYIQYGRLRKKNSKSKSQPGTLELVAEITRLIKEKELVLKKWDKKKFGETPADCK